MFRRIAFLVALVVALASTSVVAGAATTKTKTKTHTLNVNLQAQAHSVGSTASGANLLAAAVTEPHLGSGAAVFIATTSGNTQTSTFTEWGRLGSLRGNATITTNATNTAFTGTATVTGGTGTFKKAKAKSLPITGTVDLKTGILTINITGKLTY